VAVVNGQLALVSEQVIGEPVKRCCRCRALKPLDQFHRNRSKPDGLHCTCVACKRADDRAWSRENRRARAAAKKRYRRQHPERVRAGWRVKEALRTGRLARPDRCEDCGRACIPHGHHDDYEKPLQVRWLCNACHARAHHPVEVAA
jgi:hypothetical protein